MSSKTDQPVSEQKLYRSISEVSALLDIKPHVLRYWETQFPSLRPRKNRAGNRMYRPEEVDLLGRIRELLYAKRFTIEGARRLLIEERRSAGRAGKNGSAPAVSGNGRVSVTSHRREDSPGAEPAAALAALRAAEESVRLAEGRDLARSVLLREVREALRALSADIRGASAESTATQDSSRSEAAAPSTSVEPLEVPVGAGAGLGR